MIFRRRQREDPRLEMTSLVDILFLLIIFFTVTTTFAPSAGIDVNLPQASAERPIEKTKKLNVVVDKQSKTYVEGEQVSDRKLRRRFQSLADSGEDLLVIIQADKYTPHGSVVAVMDMAQATGISRLAIAIEKKDETEPQTMPPPPKEKPENKSEKEKNSPENDSK
ncbi:MAG: biopolymer transporter ExbD [bacterium]